MDRAGKCKNNSKKDRLDLLLLILSVITASSNSRGTKKRVSSVKPLSIRTVKAHSSTNKNGGGLGRRLLFAMSARKLGRAEWNSSLRSLPFSV